MNYILPTALRIDSGRCKGEIVVANPKPEFSWAIIGAPGTKQVACRVEVLRGEDRVWDSRWVETEDMKLRYEGTPLDSGTLYEVVVSLRNDKGKEGRRGGWFFRTALLDEWDAPWIMPKEDFGDAAIYFETEFELDEQEPLFCVLFASGIGYQQIRINDVDVTADEYLSPAISSYHKRCYYTVHGGLEKLLKVGLNRLVITVAPGWRRNRAIVESFPSIKENVEFFGPPQLTAILNCTLCNGETLSIKTNTKDWQCFRGPVVFSDLFRGEIYDARMENEEDRQPVPCVLAGPQDTDGTFTRLVAQELEPIRAGAKYHPISVRSFADGYIFDMGQNIAGVCELNLPSGLPEGIEITMTHGEILDENGDIYMAPLRGATSTDTYITGPGGKKVTWTPRFTYHGFRYVKVNGLPFVPEKSLLKGIQFYTAIDNHSRFVCGSALVNSIQKLVLMTERDNLHSIATDCPQRDERQGWMNDATVRFEELPYNFDAGRLFPKIAQDIIDTQVDGAITCTAPYVLGARPADPVSSSFLITAKMSYLHYGNIAMLKETYPAMCAWNDYLAHLSKDGILEYTRYGDWASPEYACQPNSPRSAVTPGAFMSTGYHYFNSVTLAWFARILGLDNDADRHESRAQEIQNAFLNKWLGENGIVGTGSQACQAFALWLGILPEDVRQVVAQKMNETVERDGMRFTTGNLCTLYLMEMLTEYGYIDTAWELITREEYPSYGYMIQNGATTVWERFELKKDPGMNSHCHPMYGSIGKWFWSHLAGITPTAAGFSKVRIAPYMPSKLLMTEATLDTCKGDINVRWHKSYGATRLFITIPVGVTANIHIPGGVEEIGSGSYLYEFD